MFPARLRMRKLKLLLLSTIVVLLFVGVVIRIHTHNTSIYYVDIEVNEIALRDTFPRRVTVNSITQPTQVHNLSIVKSSESERKYVTVYKDGKHPKRYLFALHFYEQLGRATRNLIQLASLGKFGNRQISLPFVNNSRMSGVQHKANNIDHFRSKPISKSFSSLSTYYDTDHFNNTLLDRGYSTFIAFQEFATSCRYSIDVMVHFIYPEQNTFYSTLRWFNTNKTTLERIIIHMKERGGWFDCSFLDTSEIVKELRGITIQKLICVDPDIMVLPEVLEIVIFERKPCIGILFWKGSGEIERAKFSTHPSIERHLHNSELKHNKTILHAAQEFVANTFGKSQFLSIHIRAEKLFLDLGLNWTLACLKEAALTINEARETYALSDIFLSTDFSKYGSDTFTALTKFSDFLYLEDFFVKMLDKKPIMFSPTSVMDKGAVSLIEMDIIAKASFLVTIGRGNFHSWLVEYFLKDKNTAQLQRVCHEQP